MAMQQELSKAGTSYREKMSQAKTLQERIQVRKEFVSEASAIRNQGGSAGSSQSTKISQKSQPPVISAVQTPTGASNVPSSKNAPKVGFFNRAKDWIATHPTPIEWVAGKFAGKETSSSTPIAQKVTAYREADIGGTIPITYVDEKGVPLPPEQQTGGTYTGRIGAVTMSGSPDIWKIDVVKNGKLTTPEEREAQLQGIQRTRATEQLKAFKEQATTLGTSTEDGSAPTTFFGKVWQGVKNAGTMVYEMSPFGALQDLSKRNVVSVNYGGFVGLGNYPQINVMSLTPQEASEKIYERKQAEANYMEKINLLVSFGQEVSKAPEDIKWAVQEQGLDILETRGIGTHYDISPEALAKSEPTLVFTGVERPKTFLEQAYETSTGWRKVAPISAYYGLKATEMVVAGELLGAGFGAVGSGFKWVSSQIGGMGLKIGAGETVVGRGIFKSLLGAGDVITQASKWSTVAPKVFGWGTGLTITGIYGVQKVSELYSLPEGDKTARTFYWTGVAGELTGVGILIGKYAVEKQMERYAKENKYMDELKKYGMPKEDYYKHRLNVAELIARGGGEGDYIKIAYREVGAGEGGGGRLPKDIIKELPTQEPVTPKVPAKEGGTYENIIKIISPADYPEIYGKRLGFTNIVESSSMPRGFKKGWAYEVGKRGERPTMKSFFITPEGDVITSTSKRIRGGGYELENVYAGRLTGKATIEQGGLKFTRFDVEQRLLKFKPYGKRKFSVRGSVEMGTAGYSADEVAKMFEGKPFGTASKMENIRLQIPKYENLEVPYEEPRVIETKKLYKGKKGEVWGKVEYNEGRVLIREGLSKGDFEKTLLHERGHWFEKSYIPQKFYENLNTKQWNRLYSRARLHLIEKYGSEEAVKVFYKTPQSYIKEYLADSFTGKVPTSKIRTQKIGEYIYFQKGMGSMTTPTKSIKPSAFNEVDRVLEKLMKQEKIRKIRKIRETRGEKGFGWMKTEQPSGKQVLQHQQKTELDIGKINALVSSAGGGQEAIVRPRVRFDETDLGVIEMSVTKYALASKMIVSQKRKIDLKERLLQREGIKQKSSQTSQQVQRLKQEQNQMQRTQQISIQTLMFPEMVQIEEPSFPRFKEPTMPTIPAIPIFPFDMGGGGKPEVVRKIKKKRKQILGALPDFTTRILGLEQPTYTNINDALKQMSKIKTGLEIQRGGKIKFD